MPLETLTREDLALYARAPAGVTLEEWLRLGDDSIRLALAEEGDAIRDEQARRTAFYVGVAIGGGFPELAEQFEPGSMEEAGNLDALNKALGGVA